MPKDAAIMLVLLGAFATAAWVMYLAADTSKRQRRIKAQAELNGRLLDKFGSAREVVEFLQTPSGAQFVDSFSSDREEPANGILRSTHRGIILVIVAIGVLFLNWYYRDSGENPLLVIGVILLVSGPWLPDFGRGLAPSFAALGLAQRSGTQQ